MDIWFINSNKQTHLRATSVHGMLWLQTHFENDHWEKLASSQVTIPVEDTIFLLEDAQKAGLKLNFLPAISNARKF